MKGVNIMPRRKTKRRRLPNGFGQISELKGRNLRKPFRAMITVGKNEKGRPICELLKPVAYFETYNDAYAALVEYHKSPYVAVSEMTMQELFEKWSEWYFKKLTPKTSRTITWIWSYAYPIYDVKVAEIRTKHLRECIENAHRVVDDVRTEATPNVRKRLKSVFNTMLDYAVEYEIVDRNYARDMKLLSNTVTTETPHVSFTEEELKTLWKNIRIPFVKVILIDCYSGWRPLEMGRLEIANTNIHDWTFMGGVKTESGKNRIVPIHSSVRPFVREFYDIATENNSKYLINIKRKRGENKDKYADVSSYSAYRRQFLDTMIQLGLNQDHRPHDCRKTFVTLAKKYSVDEYAIKYMVGHSISDLTERVYTDRESTWFAQEIEKIKGPVGIVYE